MKTKIIGIFVCMLLIATVLPVSGTVRVEKNIMPTENDGTLSGYVTDTAMNPLEGALVRVYFHGTFEEDYTDSLGYYHVTNIPICYCLKNCTASKPGYKSEWILLGIVENTTHDFILTSGNILYVGGSGPGNYSTIQEAIDDTVDGDTVFVYDESSPYYENVRVNNAIHLIGENRETTVIDGNFSGNVVYVKTDGVTIGGFTIINCEKVYLYAGIDINANFTTVSNNNIEENNIGIAIWDNNHRHYLSNNIISDNTISSNSLFGIWLSRCNYSTITTNVICNNTDCGIHTNFANKNVIVGNQINKNKIGISLYQISNNNEISGNKITNSAFHGIYLDESSNNKISGNNITNNAVRGVWLRNANYQNISGNSITNNGICGLTLEGSYSNDIFQNNFIDNRVFNVRFVLYITRISDRNTWNGNYWGKSSTGFHMIYGKISCFGFIFGMFPWFNIDWHPAQEPYAI